MENIRKGNKNIDSLIRKEGTIENKMEQTKGHDQDARYRNAKYRRVQYKNII